MFTPIWNRFDVYNFFFFGAKTEIHKNNISFLGDFGECSIHGTMIIYILCVLHFLFISQNLHYKHNMKIKRAYHLWHRLLNGIKNGFILKFSIVCYFFFSKARHKQFLNLHKFWYTIHHYQCVNIHFKIYDKLLSVFILLWQLAKNNVIWYMHLDFRSCGLVAFLLRKIIAYHFQITIKINTQTFKVIE